MAMQTMRFMVRVVVDEEKMRAQHVIGETEAEFAEFVRGRIEELIDYGYSDISVPTGEIHDSSVTIHGQPE